MTPIAWGLPFAGLLLAIAVLPIVAPRWWARLEFLALVAGLLATPVAGHLLLRQPAALVDVAHDYASFISMLGALYVVTSGISVHGDFPAHPLTNAGILLLGGVLASLIGTTGASMLLIRLLLDVNSERKRVAHSVVFFILVVSNLGGALTPLGDPPLFLGYLAGVPFFWPLRLFPLWGISLLAVLTVYFVVDRAAYRRESPKDLLEDELTKRPLRVRGAWNGALLLGVVAATALLSSPARETAYLALAAASFLVTPRGLREEVGFSWGPLLEVAILFAGIFVTMEPALRILHERALQLGLTESWQFFWATGTLSSFLDNAPTYAAFLALARGLGQPEIAGVPARILEAISAGAVFFGAMTYIGNGPNFLVRSIAESRGIAMPSFFGYALRAGAVLLPLFAVLTALFFRP